jgi:hypothetical protein
VRDGLAERLLANVMNWSPEDVARERPILQAFALLKYDEYQQFSPGMRFVESLALWLKQFAPEERNTAYDFIRRRLVFLSEAEMAHFASIMYPDVLRPMLLARAAAADGTQPFAVSRIAQGVTFTNLQSTTLYFGLSDGARIDQFRRSNRELSHEQIFPSYEMSTERIQELRTWLAKRGSDGVPTPAIVLLDDFAGSGTSYFRVEDGAPKGKLVKFLSGITSTQEWADIVRFPDTAVIIALYVMTEQALGNIQDGARKLEEQFGARIELCQVQLLNNDIRVTASSTEPFVELIERYYDPAVENAHTRKGGTDLKYGLAGCGLPVSIHHNTPNNSLFLLWVEGSARVRPLFQRVSRHRT